MDTSVIPTKGGSKTFSHQLFQQRFTKYLLSVLYTLVKGERDKSPVIDEEY